MNRWKRLCRSAVLLAAVLLMFACSRTQDRSNFHNYLNQDTVIKGKAGVLITALGQPEEYDFTFFNNYLTHIFEAAFPMLLKLIVLRDSGTVLLDPSNVTAREEFTPATLMDCFGKTVNDRGTPYTQLDIHWVEPRTDDKPGYFLLKEKNGYIDIVEKTAIKIAASYYGRMPGNKIPFIPQHKELFSTIKKMLTDEFPGTPFRTAWSMYPDTVKQAIDELLKENVDTIVICDLFPVYSNLEQFNALFVKIRHMVAGRANIVYTPSVGAYGSYRRTFAAMARDEIKKHPNQSKKLLILTRHGFPEMKGEPYHDLAPAYYENLRREVEHTVKGTNTSIVFADTEFAGNDDDPDNKRLSSAEALEQGIEKQYDVIIFVLVDFLSENTDTIFCAREETLKPIHFKHKDHVPYTDYSQPFRTELNHASTEIIIAGAPVGDTYRPLIARGIFDAVATALREESWPDLQSGTRDNQNDDPDRMSGKARVLLPERDNTFKQTEFLPRTVVNIIAVRNLLDTVFRQHHAEEFDNGGIMHAQRSADLLK